jgi:hypothetical protein
MQRRAKAYDLNAERIERQYERHFGTEGAPGV